MVTHSSIFAWRIPWTEEPGRLQSMGSQRVGHDCDFTSLVCVCVCIYIYAHSAALLTGTFSSFIFTAFIYLYVPTVILLSSFLFSSFPFDLMTLFSIMCGFLSLFLVCLHVLHGGGRGNPLQYSHLENPKDRGAWRATVHGLRRVRHD